jgi:hypothetical protein
LFPSLGPKASWETRFLFLAKTRKSACLFPARKNPSQALSPRSHAS